MTEITTALVEAQKVRELRLDPEIMDLTSPEAVASTIRRAASLLCPCSEQTLIRAVVRPVEGLISDLEEFKDVVERTLEACVAYGDLVEHRDPSSSQPGTMLYAAPPTFVTRQSGSVLLVGVASDFVSPLTKELEDRVEVAEHVRWIPPDSIEDLRTQLRELGLLELSQESWLALPPRESAEAHLATWDRLLDRAEASVSIPSLTILDSQKPVDYYRGRWIVPSKQSGRFVGRRPQAFGSDVWCYVKLTNGHTERFVDLPLPSSSERGCDQAWTLQMAIDAHNGSPQRYSLIRPAEDSCVMLFYSPIPRWAIRRWGITGEPVRSRDCLFAYRFSAREVLEEEQFAQDALWLQEKAARTGVA